MVEKDQENEKMKIGVVAHVLNEKSGSRAPIDLAKALALQGNDVVFYGVEKDKDEQTERDLESRRVKISLINFDSSPVVGRIITAFRLRRQLQNDKPDILSLHCTLPFFLGCKLSGIPIVYSYHGAQFNVLHEKFSPGSPFMILLFPF